MSNNLVKTYLGGGGPGAPSAPGSGTPNTTITDLISPPRSAYPASATITAPSAPSSGRRDWLINVYIDGYLVRSFVLKNATYDEYRAAEQAAINQAMGGN